MFLLIGEGAEKERIKSRAQDQGLRNVHFLDQQAREKIPAFISASDVCLVLLKKTDVFKTVIPTKMLEFMSCSRPVIVGVDGQARQIVEESGGGIVIEPENATELAQAIHQLAGESRLRRSPSAKRKGIRPTPLLSPADRGEVHRDSENHEFALGVEVL
jgi:glycosyltransferase involved in cell wall biosynthesis